MADSACITRAGGDSLLQRTTAHREKLIDFPSQWKSLLDRTTHGRFIFDLILDTPEECRYYVESVRKASNLY